VNKEKQIYDHYYGLDLLRGISGYGVAVCHFYAFIYNNIFFEYLSFIFVEFFFVLSGFVLYPQLLKIIENKKNLLIFYKRRWLRTLPLYFICLIIISLMFNKMLTLDFLKYFLFIQDIVPGFLETSYFPVVWSLSIEEFFYLLFPIFLILINKKNFIKKINYFFLLIFLIKIFFIDNFDSNFLRTGTFFRFDAILLGFILRHIYLEINFYQSMILTLIFLFLYLFFQDFLLVNKDQMLVKFSFLILLQLLSSSVLIFFLNMENFTRFKFIKKFLSVVSSQTYSVYLTHMIFIYFLIDLKITSSSKLIVFLFLLVFTSTISYYFFEKPILKTRPKYF